METLDRKYSVEDVADEVEDGELTDSDEGYTPLQRPSEVIVHQTAIIETDTNMENQSSVVELGDETDSSTDESSSGSDDVKRLTTSSASGPIDKIKKRKKKRSIGVLRPIIQERLMQSSRPKKYNVWSESLQEESLMENLRDFDVTKDLKNDRSVENYDFSLKYRMNGENRLKRRFNSTQDDDGYQSKRSRSCGSSIKDRLGWKASTSQTKDDVNDTPRYILDLDIGEDDCIEAVARDIANKLYEEKDELLVRVVDVLGTKTSIEFFKETQRIEKDGGMMIMNGRRRRTPGGIFLFLIKTDMKISDSDKKLIFSEEEKKSMNTRKFLQACRRDQKVEELKKRLNLNQNKIKNLATRKDFDRSSMMPSRRENEITLSNPPPSPVATDLQENSPDYSSHAINHVNDSSPEKDTSKNFNEHDDENLVAYDDDILDMNCDDMDMF